MTKHAKSSTKEYRAWQRMKNACNNPKVTYYRKYGAKGVTVCNEWKDSFHQFLQDMGPLPRGCNGLELLDPNCKEFNKYNARWTFKKAGRPVKMLKLRKKPAPRTTLKNRAVVCLSMDKELVEYIRKQAYRKSLEEGVYIEANELMRQALYAAFPMNQQTVMNQ